MTPILPDFDQATFEPGTAIGNPYFPLTPGTVLSYKVTEYELEEIIEEVAEELAEDIAEEIAEELAEELVEEITEELIEELTEQDDVAALEVNFVGSGGITDLSFNALSEISADSLVEV